MTMRVRELLQRKGANSGVVTVKRDAPLSAATRLLMNHRIGGLPVVDDNGELVGIVTETDLITNLDCSSGYRRRV
jgi:CBS domain-containing protein